MAQGGDAVGPAVLDGPFDLADFQFLFDLPVGCAFDDVPETGRRHVLTLSGRLPGGNGSLADEIALIHEPQNEMVLGLGNDLPIAAVVQLETALGIMVP